jgi:hypothetical protein
MPRDSLIPKSEDSEQRNNNAFVKTEVQETGVAQQQSIPLLQIVFMKFLEPRFRAAHRDAVEIIPTKVADSAITVSLAPKVEPAKWQRRKLGDRTWCEQGDRDPLAAGVLAGDARDTFQQDVSLRCQGYLADDYLRPFEVRELKPSDQQSQL